MIKFYKCFLVLILVTKSIYGQTQNNSLNILESFVPKYIIQLQKYDNPKSTLLSYIAKDFNILTTNKSYDNKTCDDCHFLHIEYKNGTKVILNLSESSEIIFTIYVVFRNEDAALSFTKAYSSFYLLKPDFSKPEWINFYSKQNSLFCISYDRKTTVVIHLLDYITYRTIEDAYIDSAFTMGKTQNFEKAIYYFTKAIEIDLTNDILYINRGIAKDKTEDYSGAINDFTKAIQIDPHNINVYSKRGMAEMMNGSYDKAIIDFSKVIEYESSNSYLYLIRGHCCAKSEDFNNAIKDFTKVIELEPNDRDAYYYRGLSYATIGESEKGCNDFHKANELGSVEASKKIEDLCK